MLLTLPLAALLLVATVRRTTAAAQPTCAVTEGYDFDGNDLLGPDGKPDPQPCPDGPGACCTMCAQKPYYEEPIGLCSAWSFNHGV